MFPLAPARVDVSMEQRLYLRQIQFISYDTGSI